MRSLITTGLLLAATLVAVAKTPAQNVSPRKHPNLAAAQRFAGQAFDKLSAAQGANEFDLAGHAQKAKEALRLASEEMKLAAETANAR